MCDLKNVSSLIEKHIGSSHNTLHNIAVASADNFSKVATGLERDIVRQVSDVIDGQIICTREHY